MQALQSQINIFSQFINPLPHTSLNIFRAHIFLVCQCGCGFLFNVGFWDTGTWVCVHIFVLEDVGLSLQLCYLGVVGLTLQFLGGCGFESFLGGGSFFNFVWFGWWCFYFDFLGVFLIFLFLFWV